ncbi:MAG: hypothetical protein Fur007_21100 [Rhodoferax sp.]
MVRIKPAVLAQILAISVVGAPILQKTLKAEQAELALHETRQQAQLASANLETTLAVAQSIVHTLSSDPQLVQALARFGPDVPASTQPIPQRAALWSADPQLKSLSERATTVVQGFGINSLWVTNAAGDTVAAGHAAHIKSFLGTNYADRAYFKAAQQGQLGRQFAVGRVTNVYGLYFSAPVIVRDRFVGMVGLGLSLPQLNAKLSDLDTVVTDDLDVIVQAKDPARVLQTMPGTRVAELTPEQRTLRYKRVDFEAAPIRALQIDGLPPLHVRTIDGALLAIQSSATERGTLRVYVQKDLGRAFRSIDSEQRWGFALLTALVLMTAALVAGAARYVVQTHRHKAALESLNAALAQQARTDALTGCANRRAFMQALDTEHDRAQRYRTDFCVLSLDVDFFKRVNDTHGHAAGDQVLKHLVVTLQQHLRDADTLGRIGGEEFCILLPQTSAQGGMAMAERLRAAVAASAASFDDLNIAITISVGGSAWTAETTPSTQALLAQADDAMYRAKQTGRNRVAWAEAPDITVP